MSEISVYTLASSDQLAASPAAPAMPDTRKQTNMYAPSILADAMALLAVYAPKCPADDCGAIVTRCSATASDIQVCDAHESARPNVRSWVDLPLAAETRRLAAAAVQS